MNIIKIGTDIVQIRRIEQACIRSPRFAQVILSPMEYKAYTHRFKQFSSLAAHTWLAGRFCLKEALYKTLSDFNYRGNWHEASFLNQESGAPTIQVHGELARLQRVHELNWHISLSHEKEYAVAFILCYKEN